MIEGTLLAGILLGAALETGLSLLAEIGVGDELRALRDRWAKTEERKRRRAFAAAWKRAVQEADDKSLDDLLHCRPFQEEVAARLLDPAQGPDLAAIATRYCARLSPAQARALRRFFSTLETALLKDEIWGPPIARFQEKLHHQEVKAALAERNVALSAHELVHRLSAHLEGAGAIAQDGSVAAGAGGVAIGQLIQVFIQQLIVGGTPGTTARSLRQRYLEEVAREANLLPWDTIDVRYADSGYGESLRLVEVYTDLDTTDLRHVEREEDLRQFLVRIHEAQRVPAQEAANQAARLLIMGDPGAGKTTFIKHLAYKLAQARLAAQPEPWLARLRPWDHGALLPVLVELRLAAAFAAKEGRTQGTRHLLLAYLRDMLKEWQLESYWPELDQALRESSQPPVLLLLDGLDEVSIHQRQLVVDMVNDFVQHYERHRYVVTCRPYAYVGQPWRLHGFREVTLAPFSEEQINRFVENWYHQLVARNRMSHGEANQRMAWLQEALRRPDLRSLAEQPLLLMVMVQLHSSANKLPEDRTQLYADIVKLLLERWEMRLGGEGLLERREMRQGGEGLLERLAIPGLKMSDLEAGLYEVAYRAHSRQSKAEGTADIGEGDLRQWLAPYLSGDYNKAGEFVGYIRERAGLLIRHKTEAYTFPHSTFQWFLAACHLVTSEKLDYVAEAPALARNDLSHWHDVFVLAAGYAARNHRLGQAIAAVNGLCPNEPVGALLSDRQALLSAVLAGKALLEIGLVGVRRLEAGQALLRRVRTWLIDAIRQDTVLEAKERVAAGPILAKLGDRDEVTSIEAMQFCFVPGGPFSMGDEQSVTTYVNDFWISRFPVTNDQFRRFAYDEDDYYWMEALEEELWSNGRYKGRYEKEGRSQPLDYGEPYNLPNHPAVGISWYEALAFTRWLDNYLHQRGFLGKQWEVRLPTEAQWEKAARGGWSVPAKPIVCSLSHGLQVPTLTLVQNPKRTRLYPWDVDDIGPEHTNYSATKVGTTTAVGCFPRSKSCYGAEEMSGNVWEWMRDTVRRDTPRQAYLRGGSFKSQDLYLRCTARLVGDPSVPRENIGFRIVLEAVDTRRKS